MCAVVNVPCWPSVTSEDHQHMRGPGEVDPCEASLRELNLIDHQCVENFQKLERWENWAGKNRGQIYLSLVNHKLLPHLARLFAACRCAHISIGPPTSYSILFMTETLLTG